MKRVFGIKEAKAASVFATTPDQRRTVLAVVGMLGMTVNLAKEAIKKTDKLSHNIVKLECKADKLRGKALAVEDKGNSSRVEYSDLVSIIDQWDV